MVNADPASGALALKREMLEACTDEDLEYGLRIAAFGSVGVSRGYGRYGFGYAGYGGGGSNPLVVYRVYPDGHEELVRGVEIARIGLREFKRILAAGDTPHVINIPGRSGRTVVVPALLFDELDLARIDRDFDKPPILPSPLARRVPD